jgi:hypothetical protein
MLVVNSISIGEVGPNFDLNNLYLEIAFQDATSESWVIPENFASSRENIDGIPEHSYIIELDDTDWSLQNGIITCDHYASFAITLWGLEGTYYLHMGLTCGGYGQTQCVKRQALYTIELEEVTYRFIHPSSNCADEGLQTLNRDECVGLGDYWGLTEDASIYSGFYDNTPSGSIRDIRPFGCYNTNLRNTEVPRVLFWNPKQNPSDPGKEGDVKVRKVCKIPD